MNDLQDVSRNFSHSYPRPNALRRLIRGLLDSLERARTRRLLSQLDGRDLADLGLSHADRLSELDKPFWR
ncbi:DUF1127 domain-containing protein [Pseudomonas zeae]|jgi:uncharacterized protein YjiS (DUF1127 family)|uniref:DUF1127 domain-containing protein n=1 Tax=Pseudomonas zeae TaxID=2745510 RepID=A0A9E6TBX6_9PSED|nr:MULTISPECIES: DUF1127 domain-containing protein [Pseudomonas]MDX9675437.1 DUF1127 domain-containing protein [Pseudomonas zeae]QXI12140.1 DUF1127 domain-containing protein [Pseudomonas zeae]UUT12890.1 DUF1127 domain-containing protein [Pseudomonas zeae]SEM80394.1 Uncharacterized conserved protein YjiS, DUF1127 family [Pseudomonas sp. ok266]